MSLFRPVSRHLSKPWQQAIYVFVNGFVSIAILAGAAWATGTPLVFPSLGPTAYVLYLTPLSPSASPRDCLLGHAIGIACGFGALALTGLGPAPAAGEMVTLPRIVSAALSLSATAAAMVLLRVDHAPACATTLIVSLGIISRPVDLLLIEASVLVLVTQAFALNRLVGLPYPLWSAAKRGPQ